MAMKQKYPQMQCLPVPNAYEAHTQKKFILWATTPWHIKGLKQHGLLAEYSVHLSNVTGHSIWCEAEMNEFEGL